MPSARLAIAASRSIVAQMRLGLTRAVEARCSTAAAACAGILVLTLLAGCSPEARQKVLPYFLDRSSGGSQEPLPPTRRVRRDLLLEIEKLKRDLADARATATALAQPPEKETQRPVEQAGSWDEAAALMPKDVAGRVDWVRALKAGTIAPRPSPDPKAPAQAVLDLDLELTTSGSRSFRARYPHAPHTAWLACSNCHPAIFPLGRSAARTAITMGKIRAGESCGTCHGTVAFGVEGECGRCHTGIPAKSEWRRSDEPRAPMERAASWDEAVRLLPVTLGTPDWVKALEDGLARPRPGTDPKAEEAPQLPLDVELVTAGNAAFQVVFPHAAHTAWLTCDNCHPAIFQMAKGADPITMGKIFAGEYCGRCHGNVAFPVTACGRCHPLLAGAK